MISKQDFLNELWSYTIGVDESDGTVKRDNLLEKLDITTSVTEWDSDYEYTTTRYEADVSKVRDLLRDPSSSYISQEEAIEIIKKRRDEGNQIAKEICERFKI